MKPWITLVVSAAAGFLACSAATPGPEEPERQLVETAATGPADVVEGQVGAPADTGPTAEVAAPEPPPPPDTGPREDPLPWASLEERYSDRLGEVSDDDLFEISRADLDGDGQEELVINHSAAEGLDSVGVNSAVWRRTGSGYRAMRFSTDDSAGGRLSVVNLPRGLIGLFAEYSSCVPGRFFEILVLQPDRARLTVVFEGSYNDETDRSEALCVDEHGSEYHPTIRATEVYVERGGLRVLEEIQEDRGCPGSPQITSRRLEDLLVRAGLLPPQ